MAYILIAAALYFLPALVGHMRHKRNENSITIVNLFLGWTLVGWVVALAWALSNDAPAAVVAIPPVLCSSCGKYSPGGGPFCGQCGKRLAQA